MADNVLLPLSSTAGSTTAIVATEDIGGAQYQRMKLTDGSSGSTSPIIGATTTPGSTDMGLVVRPIPSGVQSILVTSSTVHFGDVSLSSGTQTIGTVLNATSTAQIGSVSLLAGSSSNVIGSVTLSAGSTANALGSVALLAGSSGNMLGTVVTASGTQTIGTVLNATSTNQIGSVSLLAGSSANVIGSVTLAAGSSGNMLGTVVNATSTNQIGSVALASGTTGIMGAVQLATGTTGLIGSLVISSASTGPVSLLAGSSANIIGSVALVAGSSANILGSVTLAAVSTAVVHGAVTLAAGSSAVVIGQVSLLLGTSDNYNFMQSIPFSSGNAARTTVNTTINISIIAANASRKALIIASLSTLQDVALGLSTAAVTTALGNASLYLPSRGVVSFGLQGGLPLFLGPIRGINITSTTVGGGVAVTEFT